MTVVEFSVEKVTDSRARAFAFTFGVYGREVFDVVECPHEEVPEAISGIYSRVVTCADHWRAM